MSLPLPEELPDDEFSIAPPDGNSREEMLREIEGKPMLPLADSDRQLVERPQPVQFRIRELLLLTTFFCLSASAFRWLPFVVFALLGGIVSFLLLLACEVWQEGSVGRHLRILLVAALTTYLLCIVAAASGAF